MGFKNNLQQARCEREPATPENCQSDELHMQKTIVDQGKRSWSTQSFSVGVLMLGDEFAAEILAFADLLSCQSKEPVSRARLCSSFTLHSHERQK